MSGATDACPVCTASDERKARHRAATHLLSVQKRLQAARTSVETWETMEKRAQAALDALDVR